MHEKKTQFRALLVGNVQYSVRRFQSVKYCELRRFTGPIKRHVTSTVQKLIKGMQRTGLNRHRRGYVTKERVQRHVPFLVPGPIGLARSQFLNFHLIIIIFIINISIT